MSKPFWKSRTLWVNVVGSAILVLNSATGHYLPADHLALLLGLLNVLLRFLTHASITVS